MHYDFCGYATRNGIRCSDGRIIMKDAFREQNGTKVPLVWNHQHKEVGAVLGHGILENREDGVFVYSSFNNTPEGKRAKELVRHGDITALSIYADKLKETGGRVMHGVIREVSLVLAGANPGATIDSYVAHSDGGVELDQSQGWFYSGMEGELYHGDEDENALSHADKDDEEEDENEDAENFDEEDEESTDSDDSDTEDEDSEEEDSDEAEEDAASETDEEEEARQKRLEKRAKQKLAHADQADEDVDDEETVGDILNSMTDKQKVVMMALMEDIIAKSQETTDDEEESTMKHNLFDNETAQENVLSHSDEEKILEMAKTPAVGSLKAAMNAFCENESLAHGFDTQSLTILFPEYQDVKPGAPEMLTTDQGWITKVLDKVHKSRLSHIRVRFADIRDIETMKDGKNLRAKGYTKGTQKALTGDISVLYRTTDPQTVYVRTNLHRDDVIDIQDFDYVSYMYQIDRMNLNEELATAILLGDGRTVGDAAKIKEDKIIPIWKDKELFTIHRTVDFDAMKASLQGSSTNQYFGENYIWAETFVQELLYGREDAKNVGQGDLYITPHALNKMLLARDRNGRRIYNTVEELRSALNVNSIITVEQFEGKKRTAEDNKEKELLAILVDLKNYHLGAAKGGEITHFTDFDINFNTLQSLLETRTSGMNTRPLSALVLEADVADDSDDDDNTSGSGD